MPISVYRRDGPQANPLLLEVAAVVAAVLPRWRLEALVLAALDDAHHAARRGLLVARPRRRQQVLVREVGDGLEDGHDVGPLGLRTGLLHGLEEQPAGGPRE